MEQNVVKILLAVSGSCAARHIPSLVKALLEVNDSNTFEIRVVVTKNAKHFFDVTKLPSRVLVYDESAEWAWRQCGDPVTHIDLPKWADVLVIAPLSANSLAKLAQGICDNLLTTSIRAWDLSKPSLFCPAMNRVMWKHPITQTHTNTLKSWGFKEVPPIPKLGMNGDFGPGGLATLETIVSEIKMICDEKYLNQHAEPVNYT